MRGKAKPTARSRFTFRITPAYAGKSVSIISTAAGIRDHPRLCGEKVEDVLAEYDDEGSPPPMRGKGHKSRIDIVSVGITPAYAGKSIRQLRLSVVREDHPRLCGEKSRILSGFPAVEGSPPPMRGKALSQ